MKKMLAALMAMTMALSLTACGSTEAKTFTGEELATILTESRDAHSERDMPVYTSVEEEGAQMIFEFLGLNPEDCEAVAVSASMMNVHAYGIVIVKPVAEKAEDVSAALDNYIAMQQRNFEFYLPDQKEVADSAVKKTLEDGTMLMVMCDNAADIAADIETALTAK